MIKILKLIENSSNLTGYHYDEKLMQLLVEFKAGNIYWYDGVPKNIADEFASSASKGSYLAANIKNKYPCSKLIDAAEENSEEIAKIAIDS